jgi:hypothetical protein
MPTSHPRYTVTDTGATAELLDLAQQAWPEVTDRRQLLLRLAAAGGVAVRVQLDQRSDLVARQREALSRSRTADLVDEEILLGDAAWG